MRLAALWPALAIAALSVGVATLHPATSAAQERTAANILDDLQAVELPQFDPTRQGEADYTNTYLKDLREAQGRRASLIGELREVAPDHEQIARLMQERWQILSSDSIRQQELADELDRLIAEESNPLSTEAAFFRAMNAVRGRVGGAAEAMASIEDFIRRAPEDERGAYLLYVASQYLHGLDADQKSSLLDRVLDEYPESRYAATARGALRQSEAVGQPFELTFQDAISGATISVQDDLKGKVVVVDFWATWCGPCVAEMPHMKELYAEFKERGVEFIGVSLDMPADEGGLESLKKYVADNEISWPQYYQGNGWESEFSRSWGINAIPTMFVVDAEGKLASTEARGKLEALIPELLSRAGAAGSGGE